MQNFSSGVEFDLHENECADETNFQKNGFARRIALKQRQKANCVRVCHIAENLRKQDGDDADSSDI